MISQLRGRLSFSGDKFIIIDVSGVGYKLFVSNDTLLDLNEKEEVSLWTHLVVRETALDLYGFLEKPELEFFEMLLGVSGIGPKSALGIMGVTSIDTLKSAISAGDSSYLTKVSGIGSKNAQKIIIELQNKLGKAEDMPPALKEEAEAIEALQALGYSSQEARQALKKVENKDSGTSNMVKEALRIMGK